MKHIFSLILFLTAVALLIFGLVAYIFKTGIDEQKIQIKRALVSPPNISIETIQGKNLPTQRIVDDDTLLGIDSNHNGIRDDIELKIFETYKSPIKRAVLLQSSRAHQRMLTDPHLLRNAKYWEKSSSKYIDCIGYLYENKKIQKMDRNIVQTVSEWQYNNKKRVKQYLDYNIALSGGVYSIKDGTLQDCEFDVEDILKIKE